jgi:hypothetical protein
MSKKSKYGICHDNLVKTQAKLEDTEFLAKKCELDKDRYRETTIELKDNIDRINQLGRVQQKMKMVTIDKLNADIVALKEEIQNLKMNALHNVRIEGEEDVQRLIRDFKSKSRHANKTKSISRSNSRNNSNVGGKGRKRRTRR